MGYSDYGAGYASGKRVGEHHGEERGAAGVMMLWEEALTRPVPASGVRGNARLGGLYRKTEDLRRKAAFLDFVAVEVRRGARLMITREARVEGPTGSTDEFLTCVDDDGQILGALCLK
jgi:hypothetical protein